MDALVEILIVVGVMLIYLVPAVITGLKGKQGMVTAGVFLHPVWWVGAIRLARPDSYWARRFYDDAKRRRALERHDRGAGPAPDHLAALTGDGAGDA
jgi:hypothetical protein